MIQLLNCHYSAKNLMPIQDTFQKLLTREDLGYLNLPLNSKMSQDCIQRVKQLQGVDTLCVVGTGGSSFGGKVLKEVFNIENVLFFENVDALGFNRQIKALSDLKHTHWVFVSKSGGTIEVLAQLNFIDQIYKNQGLELAQFSTVITEFKESPLYDWAQRTNIPIIEAPLDVGGRFSVLSPAGLFPAAFGGVDLEKILQGAQWSLQQEQLVCQIVDQVLQSWEEKKWITVFWSYCDLLKNFNGWTQQLWAESLAKTHDLNGQKAPRVSTPMGMLGTVDQHSLLQQIMEGSRDKFVFFLRVESAENSGEKLKHPLFAKTKDLSNQSLGELLKAEALATQGAVSEMGVPSLTLVLKNLDEQSLGALFMLLQLIVGTLGEVLNINAYDQPGVELGKKLALEFLKNKEVT